jgi:hypothetical protein
MGQLGQTDLAKTKRLLFIVNNRGETLIAHPLPLDFSLLSVLTEHVNAYTIEYFHKRELNMELPQIISRQSRIFVPPGIKVIDLSLDALDKTKDARADDIMIRPRSSLADNLSIKVLESADRRDVVMGFETLVSENRKVPLWLIDKNEKTVTLEIVSNKPLFVSGYNCFVTTEDPHTQELVKWTLQGSNDGLKWVNLDMRSNILPLQKAMLMNYPINDRMFFSRYRFLWNKEEYPGRIGVALIKLSFLN